MADDNNEYISIDSRVFDKCLAKKDDFINRYAAISTRYEAIIKDLSANWKGASADVFLNDANVIRKNIGGIADILSNMCSTLVDVKAQLAKTDKALGEFNRDPNAE